MAKAKTAISCSGGMRSPTTFASISTPTKHPPVTGRAKPCRVRLALSLALEQAQWAALNGQPQVFEHALAEAKEVLRTNFNQDDSQSKMLSARLDELSKQPVSVMTPDLAQSLSAVQAYLERRHASADAPTAVKSQPAEAREGTSP